MVKIGDNRAVRFAEMNLDRIRLRKDLRTKVHVAENRAYVAEWDSWTSWDSILSPDEVIDDLYESSATI